MRNETDPNIIAQAEWWLWANGVEGGEFSGPHCSEVTSAFNWRTFQNTCGKPLTVTVQTLTLSNRDESESELQLSPSATSSKSQFFQHSSLSHESEPGYRLRLILF